MLDERFISVKSPSGARYAYTICYKCGNVDYTNINDIEKLCYVCHSEGTLLQCCVPLEIMKTFEQQDEYREGFAKKSPFDPELVKLRIKSDEINRKLYNQVETQIAKAPPVVECPYCHSRFTKKIGVVGRMTSFGLLGFGSGKVGKQWHCEDCGSDF